MVFALSSTPLTRNPCSSHPPLPFFKLRTRHCTRVQSKVNHKEIGRRLAERCSFSEEDGAELTKIVMDLVRESVLAGETVVLHKLGTLSSRLRSETTARNPRTGEPVHVPEKRVPIWRHSKVLKEGVAELKLESSEE